MTNPLNPTFPIVTASLSQSVKQPTRDAHTPRRRTKTLALAFCLSLIPALGIGATSYHLINQAVTKQIIQSQSDQPSISPALQRQLLLQLVLASGVTALLGSAIALLTYRLRSAKPRSPKAMLLGELTSQNQPVDLDYLYKRVVEGTREILATDRVIVYIFDDNWNGTIVAESVAPEWTPSLGNQISDTCMKTSKGGMYQNGRVRVINDIHQAGLSECHIQLLEDYQVKSNMVVPILKDDQLLGLIIAHQCDKPRIWQPDEIDFFVQLSTLLALRLSRLNFLQQREKAEQFRSFSDIALRIRQSLDLETIFNTAATEIQHVLNADRILICRLTPSQRDGTVVAESVASGWPSMLGLQLHDIPGIGEGYMRDYKYGYVHAINNVPQEIGITVAERYKVRASLVVPILIGDQIVGLIIAHQCSEIRTWEQLTINLLRELSVQVSLAIEQATLLKSMAIGAKQTQLLADFTTRIRQSLNSQDIFSISVEEIRDTLETDRVLIYRFHSNGTSGEITAQSVSPDWTPASAEAIHQLFREENFAGYQTGTLWVAHDIYEADLKPSHVRLLKRLQIQARMVAPILCDGKLVGLLCVHQCSVPRSWQQSEFYLLKQLAAQIGFALDQVQLIEQVKIVSDQQQQQTDELRRQLLSLIESVEETVNGDLTARADVTNGEIGTVADFFNAVIESLRQIVTQVKQTTTQVNASLGENEEAIRQLADIAFNQVHKATRTLDSIEQMTHSIQQVADSAHHAATVASTASATAQEGGVAMEQTVEKILSLQETVAETAEKVGRLGESSQQISQVVSLIKEIALQTNLLALNAGIEASRAGEEGKGFAAVAKEIGELATHSTKATKEIEQIVETIQLETAQVFEAMQLGVIQVVEGTHIAEVTKQSLGRILDVSHQIDRLVESISQATVSQVNTSQAVTDLMKEMTLASEQTSQYSHQISGALQQTVAVAQQLQASVELFKVEEQHLQQ